MFVLVQLDYLIRWPFQWTANWVFTLFGKSHFWLAKLCAHVWMVCTILMFLGFLFFRDKTWTEILKDIGFLIYNIWLGWVLVRRIERLDENRAIASTTPFRPSRDPTILLVRLVMVFMSLAVIPKYLLDQKHIEIYNLGFAGSIIVLTLVLYFGSCDPPSLQKRRKLVHSAG